VLGDRVADGQAEAQLSLGEPFVVRTTGHDVPRYMFSFMHIRSLCYDWSNL
jgi:hypothetical protein